MGKRTTTLTVTIEDIRILWEGLLSLDHEILTEKDTQLNGLFVELEQGFSRLAQGEE